MTEQLIKYKETQHAFLEKLEKLKQEIETLLQHKVCPSICAHIVRLETIRCAGRREQ